MATAQQWIEGARPRTLPNAIAPVLAGSGAAAGIDGFSFGRALLAMIVALALIVGVNYSNDYSDGIRGTDEDRVGPLRLTGSGAARPQQVRMAAFSCFAVAAVAGVALSLWSSPWLILVGLGCLLGAWFYTGGRNPYGYRGYGEVAVFVFFGLVAVLGTEFTQAGRIDWTGLAAAVAIGAYSSAVLVANNLRDIPTDAETGKITLAVRLGDHRTRVLHAALLAVPFAMTALLTFSTLWALLTLAALPASARANGPVRSGRGGMELVPVLRDTGLAMLVWAVGAAVGLALR